ncbi:hypothetical protein CYMTET_29880, partial [Cymbomonas tetramitiformis]
VSFSTSGALKLWSAQAVTKNVEDLVGACGTPGDALTDLHCSYEALEGRFTGYVHSGMWKAATRVSRTLEPVVQSQPRSTPVLHAARLATCHS